MGRHLTRRDALRGLLALGLVAPSSALFAPAQRAAAQLWPPVWFWDSFTPLKLPGLQRWFRADRGVYQDSAFTTLAVADADPVGGWQDQSGQAGHATQATSSKRPALKLNIRNGLPTVRPDGVDDFLTSSGLSYAAGIPYTVCFAAFWSNITTKSILGTDNGAETFGSGILEVGGDAGLRLQNSVDAIVTATSHTTINTWTIWSITRDAGNNVAFFKNGAAAGTGSLAGTHVFNTLFSRQSTNPIYWAGDCGEIIVCNGALSATDRQRAEKWLNARWRAF